MSPTEPASLPTTVLGLPLDAQADDLLAATRQALADTDPGRAGNGPRVRARRREVIDAFRALRSHMQPRPMSKGQALGLALGCLLLAGLVYAFTHTLNRIVLMLLSAAVIGTPILLIQEKKGAERKRAAFESDALEVEALYLAQASDLPEVVVDGKPPRLRRTLLQRRHGKSKSLELVRLPRGASLPATVSLAATGTGERSLLLELQTASDDERESFGRIVVSAPRPLREGDVVVVTARIDERGDVEVQASEPGGTKLHATIEYEAPLPVAVRQAEVARAPGGR